MFRRWLSNSIAPAILQAPTSVRVRFAPSPTGQLHLGGLRTALYNFYFARAQQGRFILRIEDTDQTRLVPGATEKLIDVCRWAGIDFDEGPHIGGDYGPYVQSQRFDIYRDYANRLIENGKTYRCFCSPERLNKIREQSSLQGHAPMYDRHCRTAFRPEVSKAKADRGEPFTIRLKVPVSQSGSVIVDDAVYGRVAYAFNVLDDCVLLKSDGGATYHLANVVDDHLMRISHVLRGEEWLLSTPKHLLLYQAFGWQPPIFAHLPLLRNADGSKLSKRQGDVFVENYRERGFLPNALNQYISHLGQASSSNLEVIEAVSLKQLVDTFDLKKMHRHGAVVDSHRLEACQRAHFLSGLEDPILHQELIDRFRNELIKKKWFQSEQDVKQISDSFLTRLMESAKDRVYLIPDLVNYMSFAFIQPDYNSSVAIETRTHLPEKTDFVRVCQHLISKIQEAENQWNDELISKWIKQLPKETKLPVRQAIMSIRYALTAQSVFGM